MLKLAQFILLRNYLVSSRETHHVLEGLSVHTADCCIMHTSWTGEKSEGGGGIYYISKVGMSGQLLVFLTSRNLNTPPEPTLSSNLQLSWVSTHSHLSLLRIWPSKSYNYTWENPAFSIIFLFVSLSKTQGGVAYRGLRSPGPVSSTFLKEKT